MGWLWRVVGEATVLPSREETKRRGRCAGNGYDEVRREAQRCCALCMTLAFGDGWGDASEMTEGGRGW